MLQMSLVQIFSVFHYTVEISVKLLQSDNLTALPKAIAEFVKQSSTELPYLPASLKIASTDSTMSSTWGLEW
jgi:hypothetical protein